MGAKEAVQATLDSEALMKTVNAISSAAVRETDLEDSRRMVTMSNNFVVGIEQGSRLAHKISRICIAQLRAQDEDLPMMKITSDDMVKMGYTRERLTSHADSVLNEILNLRIKISTLGTINRSARLTGINVFSIATVIPGEGAVIVQLNPLLKEHFLHLSQDYTQYEMQVALKLNSVAASHLHELLVARSRQFGAQIIEFDIEDLAALLGYSPREKGTVFSPSEFTNSTIKRAVKMINEVTECHVEYYPVKTGRKISSVRFLVESQWKTAKEKDESLERQNSYPEGHVVRKCIDETKSRMLYVLESGQTSIFPEEIIKKGKKTNTEPAAADIVQEGA